MIYLLGRVPPPAAGQPKESMHEDMALSSLERMVLLLEQYFHPSNTGKWTPGLAIFLKYMCYHLNERLVSEHSVRRHGKEDSDSGEI